ncbi:hypothetical protein AXF42_Ash004152 [Apostasia shenzhenica]|uniref:Calcium uniporter protein C-terminal domain-containing protein n=1 Tax=Apostasia shenzhenica TaxID=1088818 RepID=A0A2I0A225_9ASPA|nr:hypothetical protein AXF42_Ash004152 [Apostasia shenzhenica]
MVVIGKALANRLHSTKAYFLLNTLVAPHHSSAAFPAKASAADKPELRKIFTDHHRIPFQRQHVSQSAFSFATAPLSRLPFAVGDELIQRIRSAMGGERSKFGDLAAPPQSRSEDGSDEREGWSAGLRISRQDAMKLLKASRIEAVRARLREISKSCISYSEFAEICSEAAGGTDGIAREIVAALDNSGAVIILRDVVVLRPEQLARAIESVIPMQRRSDPLREELRDMEAKKLEIDGKAEMQVKRELWTGLGLVLLQTAGFMRLTFWELSWDVMEPICFFAASFYFIIGYGFFLRTSREPSFEGLFASRFARRQRRLMKAQSFDLPRFNQLRRALNIAGIDESQHVGTGSFARLRSGLCDCGCGHATN